MFHKELCIVTYWVEEFPFTPFNSTPQWVPNPRSNEEISLYNQTPEGTDVLIDDVFEIYKTNPAEFFRDYCHMTEKGFEELGNHVADFLCRLL